MSVIYGGKVSREHNKYEVGDLVQQWQHQGWFT